MKRKIPFSSAYFTLRSLAAFVLGSVGVLLALFAFNVVPGGWDNTEDGSYREVEGKVTSSSKWFSRSMAGKSTDSDVAVAARAGARGPVDMEAKNKIAAHRNELGQVVYSVSPSGFDLSPPLARLAKTALQLGDTAGTRPELPLPAWRVPHSDKPDPVVQVAPGQRKNFVTPNAPTTGFNFAGIVGAGSYPPDNNGSVGNDQFVEIVNTRYQVWSINRVNTTVTSLVGPIAINTLWSGFVGGNCSTRNDGDPIVLYDKVANRWLLSQFTSASTGGFYYQCVAISQTADATGSYYRYAFAVPNGNFGDYPHFGVWTDAYYMMAHGFTSAGGGSYTGGMFAAMDRVKMLAGDSTATWQVILDPLEGGHMPADLDGFAPPPGGAPGVFVSLHSSGMFLYRMKVDFATPANTTRTIQGVMPTAPATAACGGAGGNCIPQPSSAALIDSLADRLMFRLAYRNFIDHESLVISHSVDPSVTGVVSAIRWYDFRISGQPDAVCSSYPCTYQQGTIADVANGRSRWMPSISMDGAENILVGYSTTGKTTLTENHSIRYTARAKTDPLGTMTAPETTIFTGTRNILNSQAMPGRWGDYTSTSIDPADDCTFWHVNEYYLTGNTGNGNWKTQIASARFPAGAGAGQCQASNCTSRPASAPASGSASAVANNQMQVTWAAIVPAPGSYAIERAIGAPGNEGPYQPLAAVLGNVNIYTDTTVQGGVTYSYRIIPATDSAGRCQALVRSAALSATATGTCNLKPTFAGATSASSAGGSSCGVMINWSAASTSCPLSPNIRYNIFRGTTPDFTPAVGNRIATCVAGPSSYVDMNNLTSGTTYYYIVRAEDNSTGNGGECGGGNEESNSVVVPGTAYGPGVQASPGTWIDAGGDGTAFLQLNVGGGLDPIWRFVKTANDAGANHTPSGAFAYRNAGPTASDKYTSNTCSIAQTPVLTVGASGLNLTYWERHQLEKGWDGVAVEYSVNGGAWNSVPAPNNSTGNGCLASDIIADWAPLDCTGSPPANACAYPATTTVITGPVGLGTSCTDWVTATTPSAYGRRCHSIPGVNAGDQVQFRWRFTSDPEAEFAGFYLDDIAISNVRLPNSCAAATPAPPQLTSAVSRQTHNGTPYDVPLQLSGTPSVECRKGGASGSDYTMVLTFDTLLTAVDNVGVSCGTVSSSMIDGADAHRFIVNVSGPACNAQNVAVTLTGVHNAQATLTSAAVSMGILLGDTTGDRSVNSGDISQTKSQSGQSVTGSNFREDVTLDGSINSADISLVKSKSGTALP